MGSFEIIVSIELEAEICLYKSISFIIGMQYELWLPWLYGS